MPLLPDQRQVPPTKAASQREQGGCIVALAEVHVSENRLPSTKASLLQTRRIPMTFDGSLLDVRLPVDGADRADNGLPSGVAEAARDN
jgi:hypothetical protein